MASDRELQFPNPGRGERMVLYPLSDGGVALEWELPPGLVEQALAAFPLLEPIPMLYLRRTDGAGVRLAAANLSEYPAGARSGRARFEMPVVGSLQAELGLEGRRDGGWLLLARSNRLAAVPRVRGLADREDADVRASAQQATAAAADAPESAAETLRPLAQQAPGASVGAAAVPASTASIQPVPAPVPVPVPAPVPAEEQSAPQGAGGLLASAEAEAAAVAKHAVPEGSAARGPLAEDATSRGPILPAAAVWPVVSSRYPDPSLTSELHGPLRFGRVFPLVTALRGHDRPSSLSVGPAPMPPEPSGTQHLGDDTSPLTAVAGERDHPTNPAGLDERPARRQDVVDSGSSAGRGSGPLAPYPSPDSPLIRGELRVFGRASPGATLDLGGHRFRVGPGGRFSFVVALDDPALLASLLARLPGLPVAERDT